mmetsp:Transcript_37565/g.112243  ORF Transcript_37565/g.112243 Transcript_37565/m.112243 type:complete len:88 (-) Transcript_37565:846-1109(-)
MATHAGTRAAVQFGMVFDTCVHAHVHVVSTSNPTNAVRVAFQMFLCVVTFGTQTLSRLMGGITCVFVSPQLGVPQLREQLEVAVVVG